MSTADTDPVNSGHGEGQQHPIGLYFKVWILLFVLSSMSYAVDYFHFHGYLRWGLILLFMFLKAGLIISVFMHFAWEPATLKLALALPVLAILVFIGFMAVEADYTFLSRLTFMSGGK
jgi:cytochrome c oxidase subunit 4